MDVIVLIDMVHNHTFKIVIEFRVKDQLGNAPMGLQQLIGSHFVQRGLEKETLRKEKI